MKRLILLIMCTSIAVFAGCSSLMKLKEPKATIEKFELSSLSFTDVNFTFDVAIHNPYPVGLKLKKVAFTAFVEGKKLLYTETGKGMKIKKRGKEITKFNLNMKFASIIRLVRTYMQKDYLNCKIHIDIVIPLPEFVQKVKKDLKFSFKMNKKIPAIKPSVAIRNFKVKSPSVNDIKKAIKKNAKSTVKRALQTIKPENIQNMFTSVLKGKRRPGFNTRKIMRMVKPKDLDVPLTVYFDIVLKNGTKVNLKFTNVEYSFFLNGKELVKGRTSKIARRGKDYIVTVKNTFSSKKLGQSFMNSLKKKRGSFKVAGYALLQLPSEIRRSPVQLTINEKGNFKL